MLQAKNVLLTFLDLTLRIVLNELILVWLIKNLTKNATRLKLAPLVGFNKRTIEVYFTVACVLEQFLLNILLWIMCELKTLLLDINNKW